MYSLIIIINLLAISFGVEDKYFIGFSESTGRLYTRDAVIVTATTQTETSDYDPNARKSSSRFGAPCVTWEGIKGVCMRYHQCFQNETEHNVDVGSTCYDEGTKIYGICCTKELKNNRTSERNYQSAIQSLYSDDNWKVISNNKGSSNNNNLSIIWENPQLDTGRQSSQCGVSVKKGEKYERIVGGRKSSRNKWPWIIVLMQNNMQYCGASLITTQHALTAAHCTRTLTSSVLANMRAHLGEYDLREESAAALVVAQIKRAVSHREFNSKQLICDISLISLRHKVSFNRYIRPICLPSPQKSYAGVKAITAGWGRLSDNGPLPSVLQEVTLKIWKNIDCASIFGDAAPAGIVDSMMCAGETGKDSCSGDSGGPLMVRDGNTWVAAGIVSWGYGCGNTQYPGVYTRVSSFLAWIKANLNK